MSRLGKKPIVFNSSINVEVSNNVLNITGPLGSLNCSLSNDITVNLVGNSITVDRLSDSKSAKSLHGMFRSIIANMVHGVSHGFTKKMYMSGIGYRVQKKGNSLEFSLGYSHPVNFDAPEGIDFIVDGQDKFEVSGISNELVGETCAKIKKLRKKDPYKAKGIFFEDEIIRKKQGKSVKK